VGIKDVKFKISTIFPSDKFHVTEEAFRTIFKGRNKPEIYYSLYGMKESFRKRWLPKAREPHEVLAMLKTWQKKHDGEVTLHWAFIEGENDSMEDLQATMSRVSVFGLRTKFNLVRYNPFSSGQGQEPSQAHLEKLFDYVESTMTRPGSRIVPRVGFDVAASCGMFVKR
jgi:adenine C2-methylase RlmN of 23S rRNA A2503 and tRNA A37